jgi:hypothetical protein
MNFLWFCFATLPRIKIWKKPEFKNVRSPTTTKPTTNGENILISIRTEKTITITKKKLTTEDEEYD